jgi:hypothetical protein
VTEEEARALMVTAQEWELSMEDVLAAHHSYLESWVSLQVTDLTQTTLSGWRHGFEPRWDYEADLQVRTPSLVASGLMRALSRRQILQISLTIPTA